MWSNATVAACVTGLYIALMAATVFTQEALRYVSTTNASDGVATQQERVVVATTIIDDDNEPHATISQPTTTTTTYESTNDRCVGVFVCIYARSSFADRWRALSSRAISK